MFIHPGSHKHFGRQIISGSTEMDAMAVRISWGTE